MQRLLFAIAVAALGYLSLPQGDSTSRLHSIDTDTGKDATNGTIISAIDGDTLEVRTSSGTQRIRLIGIDAPEARPNDKLSRDARASRRSAQQIIALGQRASEFTRSIAPPGTRIRVTFDKRRTDSYGRLLGYVFLPDGSMLNEMIVASGFAHARRYHPNLKYTRRLEEAEQRAKMRQLGLWGLAGSPQQR